MNPGNLSQGLIGTNHSGVVQFWSGNLAQLLGIDGARAKGHSLWEVLSLRPTDRLLAAWALASGGDCADFPEDVGVGPSGTLCHLGFSPWVGGKGQHRGVLVFLRLSTEPDTLSGRLRDVERLAHTVQSVTGFVHDLNNVFTVLQTYASLIDLDSDISLTHEDWNMVLRAVSHGHDLTSGLLATTLGETTGGSPKVADLNQIVGSASNMLSRLVGAGVELAVDLSAGTLPVEVNPGQLDRILLNLALNARDAMEGRGRLVIATECGTLVPPKPAAGDAEPRPCAVVRVSDTGPGIAREIEDHLFEPFVTTKPPGKGTGLGLSSVAETVRRLGGSVEAWNVEGSGAEFRVSIPIVCDQASSGTYEVLAKSAPPMSGPRGAVSCGSGQIRGYRVRSVG